MQLRQDLQYARQLVGMLAVRYPDHTPGKARYLVDVKADTETPFQGMLGNRRRGDNSQLLKLVNTPP